MTTTPQTQVSARRPSALASRSAEWDPEATSRVLVSADGSYWGRMALRWACEHAWLANAELEVHAPPTTRPRAHVGDDGIDLAFLPIGDNYTMGPDDALKAVSLLRPARVVPIHYSTWPPIEQDADHWAARVSERSPTEPIVLKPGEWVQVR